MPRVASQIVEVCVFRFDKDQPRYLLLHRAKEEKLYPNMWQMISGVIEGGEKATDAALRELKEETGLIPAAFWNVPFVNSFYDHVHDVLNVSPLFAAQVDLGAEPKLSSEHFEYGWFSRDEAQRKLVWPGQRAGLEAVDGYIVRGQEAGRLTKLM